MAPRAKAAVLSDDIDGSFLDSSPDPLAGSIHGNRSQPKRKSTRTARQPLVSTSPSKQNRCRSISEIEMLSPSKSMVLSTPKAGGASPWRIKVTVQAEPGSNDDDMESPTVKRVTRTKTTTVPLKDADASSPVKRRGRPRKSDAAGAQTKRSATPVRRRAKSKPRNSDVGADASAADIDTDVAPKRRRGRPRKSMQPPAEDETRAEPETQPQDTTPEPPSQSALPVIQTVLATPRELQETSTRPAPLDGTSLLPPLDKKKPNTLQEVEPIDFTPPRTELSRKIRGRKGTPANKANAIIEISSDEESSSEADIITPTETDEEPPNVPTLIQTQHLKKSESVQAPAIEADDDELQDEPTFAFEEGATRMPDDTTILESENFSMISVDSLPSSGGLTSPAAPPATTPIAQAKPLTQNQGFLVIPPSQAQRSSQVTSNSSLRPPASTEASREADKSSLPAAAPRHKTPSMGQSPPSNPPPIEPARYSPSNAETPKIGRVVKAGVALQGLLDPNRTTPEAGPSRAGHEQLDQLDDLFRGFSERTRRELQAGLRLGEQLAKENEAVQSPSLSSPIKPTKAAYSGDGISVPRSKHRTSRLLTPEDQDSSGTSPHPPTLLADVQYPPLNVIDQESHLISPARSEDEMSWRVDTPPVHAEAVADHNRMVATENMGVISSQGEQANGDDYADIWQEEADRTPDADDAPVDRTPQLQDLFDQDGPVRPPRGKLPRTWRRQSSGDFQYSDESEESPQSSPSSAEPDTAAAQKPEKGKDKLMTIPIAEDPYGEDDEMSEASDDTGLFFQSNLPSLFNKRRSVELSRKRAEKRDLSQLMNEGESLLPESSPPVAGQKEAGADRANPFLNTPPPFRALRSSPVKSSPLRQEIRASDTPSESNQQFEESTLPLPQSSPFHTQVDGDTGLPMTSHQRQFLEEIAGSTDSSLRRIRDEADDYLDAYEPQERTLNEIEEVTEPSRSSNREPTIIPSSPPPIKQVFEESMLRPKRAYTPLFGETTPTDEGSYIRVSQPAKATKKPAVAKPAVATASEATQDQPAQPQPGLFNRLTTTLWSALGSPPPPAPHSILARFLPLPKVEPWTKTHYKTLDALFQLHKKQPALFSPAAPDAAGQANAALLTHFLRSSRRPFVGATYAAWGYSITLTEELVVLCAAYTQLLTLSDVSEWERLARRRIQMGDCGPGVSGETIGQGEVVRRLASVVMGENLRRDERRGKAISREGGLSVVWPQ